MALEWLASLPWAAIGSGECVPELDFEEHARLFLTLNPCRLTLTLTPYRLSLTLTLSLSLSLSLSLTS